MADPATVIATLARAGLTVATCESLTGGLIAAELTSIPGASAVMRGGLVTYATDLKCSLAGLDPAFVAAHGVINQATAEHLATAARRVCGADLGIGITGVAGPDPQDDQPVGTVWLAVASSAGVVSHSLHLDGDRGSIRSQCVSAACALVVSGIDGTVAVL